MALQGGVQPWSPLLQGRPPGFLLSTRLHCLICPQEFKSSAGNSPSGSTNSRRGQQPVMWGSPQATTFQMSYPCMVQRLCRNKERLCGTEGLSPRPGMPWGGGWLPFSLSFSAPWHLASASRLGVQLWLPSLPPLLSEAWRSRQSTWGQESKLTLGQGWERTAGGQGQCLKESLLGTTKTLSRTS